MNTETRPKVMNSALCFLLCKLVIEICICRYVEVYLWACKALFGIFNMAIHVSDR